MTRYLAEVFGYPFDVKDEIAIKSRKERWCPFTDKPCDKKSRLIRYPMGICSVQYNNDVIPLCPHRFYQDNIIFEDIAKHYFGAAKDLLLFPEIGLPRIGHFDFVIVKHKPLSSDVEDFVIVEFQTNQTTSTGALVQALKVYMRGSTSRSKNYGFGLNTYDAIKRAFIQILTKGIVLESWGHKIYWVIDKTVYENLVARYNLRNLTYNPEHSTIFAPYNLTREGNAYRLKKAKIETSSVDSLFKSFRNNPDIPSKDLFIKTLGQKISAQMGLNLRIKK